MTFLIHPHWFFGLGWTAVPAPIWRQLAHILSGRGTRTCRSPRSSSQEDDPNLVACVRYLPPCWFSGRQLQRVHTKIAKDYCILGFERDTPFIFFSSSCEMLRSLPTLFKTESDSCGMLLALSFASMAPRKSASADTIDIQGFLLRHPNQAANIESHCLGWNNCTSAKKAIHSSQWKHTIECLWFDNLVFESDHQTIFQL